MEHFKYSNDDNPCFFHVFHKELMNCTQTLGYNISPKISTTKYILHQYYDSQKYSFLLGDSSSISSTLDEDTGSV